jgi:hypothetical protein
VSSSDPTAVCDGLQEQLGSFTDYFKRWKIKGEFVENPGYLLYQMLVSTAAPKVWDSS